MRGVLLWVGSTPVYLVALVFFAFYPIASSVMWTSTAINYFVRRERGRRPPPPSPLGAVPVSVVISAYCEEAHIEETLEACLDLAYPDYEVVVIDDGSTDATVAKVRGYLWNPRLRLIAKEVNEGKAMALNDAIPCLRGEIVVVIDADARPARDLLRHLVPHFSSPRVAAVTGNPRVVERETFLARLQILEFTSIVSLLRRAQRIWGRILTMSGVVTALRKSAVIDAGLFSPDMATEDIDLTWKLQMKYYDVRYEPQAIVWMRVPTDLKGLWRQRRRWALGLTQVLRRHGAGVLRWRRRRMWPMAGEAVLSILWAYTFVVLSAVWALSYAFGVPPVGASPVPNWWGMVIASLSLVQLGAGMMLDRRYDASIVRYYPVAIFYPLVYWILMSLVTVVSTPRGLFVRPSGPARWRTAREAAPASGG